MKRSEVYRVLPVLPPAVSLEEVAWRVRERDGCYGAEELGPRVGRHLRRLVAEGRAVREDSPAGKARWRRTSS